MHSGHSAVLSLTIALTAFALGPSGAPGVLAAQTAEVSAGAVPAPSRPIGWLSIGRGREQVRLPLLSLALTLERDLQGVARPGLLELRVALGEGVDPLLEALFYRLDVEAGEIRFGDGRRGARLPSGKVRRVRLTTSDDPLLSTTVSVALSADPIVFFADDFEVRWQEGQPSGGICSNQTDLDFLLERARRGGSGKGHSDQIDLLSWGATARPQAPEKEGRIKVKLPWDRDGLCSVDKLIEGTAYRSVTIRGWDVKRKESVLEAQGASVTTVRLLAGDGLQPTVEPTFQPDGLCWTLGGASGCSER